MVLTKRRRLASLTASARQRSGRMALCGLLIAAAFGGGWLLASPALRDALLTAAAATAGAETALRAWRSLRRRQATIELLVTVAAAGALAIGEYWEAAAVTFLFLFGASLEARLLGRTRQALTDLLDLAPTVALVWRDDLEIALSPEDVRPGETVVVKPGARIPVDGVVSSGHAAVDESAITGEPLPVEKTAGATVYAGTVSQDGLLWLRASAGGGDTVLARIVARVEEAQEQAMPVQRTVERFARWYTPAVIGLSVAALLLTRRVELALTLLVIGCPGALVMAAPIAVMAGIGRAARRGMLIKGGEHLETIGRLTALALDKTGTLTAGKPDLLDVVALRTAPDLPCLADSRPASAWDAAQQRVLCWAAIAEGGSAHPLAGPPLRAARALGAVPPADAFTSVVGGGVRATYAGHTIGVGVPALVEGRQVLASGEGAELARLRAAGATALPVAVDHALVGVLGVADAPRTTAARCVRRLVAAGVRRVVMLTGDDRVVAEAIARQVGVAEVHADMLPEQKLAFVRQLQQDGYVVGMVGDGVNDAPALAAADVSIAMGAGGAAVAIDAADVVLMTDDLLLLPEVIRLARATLRTIHQNLALALLTVGALLAGVLLGDVRMADGMVIHEASVLVVILNGMRLLRA